MKQRYKYRGKTWEGNWVYGYPVYLIQENYESGIIDGIRTWWDGNEDVDPETVGQCTGRKDRGNNWVYEGMILENDGEWYTVVWSEDDCSWWASGIGNTESIALCEIIDSSWIQEKYPADETE